MRQYPVLSLRGFVMLWMALFLHLSTSANVQPFDFKVTLKAEQVALKRVMKDIEKQTGLYFMYSATGSLRVNDPVSITVTDAKLEDVLKTLMESRGISWTIMDKAIVLKAAAVKPKENKEPLFRTVSGSVLDKDGQPLPGATVQIKGTNIGTTTAVSGVFTIANVPMKQLIIQARYTGYEPQEKVLSVEGSVVFNLKPSVSNLDETVVVAYGTSNLRNVTGAISVVKGEEIRTLPNLSLDKSLQGLVPGLRISGGSGQPGAGLSNMIVRGITTGTEIFDGSTVRNPLIVIDGVQVGQEPFLKPSTIIGNATTALSNPLAQINPDDIAEISVLKDAAAISLYGTKASNGVIMITTKKGHTGKPRVTLSHQTDAGFRPRNNQPKLVSQQQYLDLVYETLRNSSAAYTDDSIRSELFSKFPYYRISGTDTSFYPAPDWDKELIRAPALSFTNNLSLSGGSPAQLYYLNLEYSKQNGLIKGSDYERASLRINLDNKFTDWFKLNITSLLSYNIQNTAQTHSESSSNPYLAKYMSPLLPIRDQYGSYISRYLYGNPTFYDISNPALDIKYAYDHTKIYRALTSFNADISFLRHFTFSSIAGIDYMNSENKQKLDPRLVRSSTSASITDFDVRAANVQLTNSLRYQLQLGQHNLNVLAAQEVQIQQTKIITVTVKGSTPYVDPYFTDISNTNYAFYSYAGKNQIRKTLSQLVNLSYDYRKKYHLNLNWRRDGVSAFGSDNPFGSYWSIGGAWILSEEPFMQGIKENVQFLKLRGSFGNSGNAAAINNRIRYTLLLPDLFLHQPALRGDINNASNPDIKWETTRQWNIGLQTDIFNGRLSLTADIYSKYTKDVIYASTLPSYSGYTIIMNNIGDIRNSGVELTLLGKVLNQKDFSWTASGNWSTNRNLLVKSYNKLNTVSSYFSNEEGREYNSYYMPVWMGVNSENGKPQWKDAEGKPTETYRNAKKEFVGKLQPDGFGSIFNTFRWKDFDLMFQLYYQYGGQMYNYGLAELTNDGQRPFSNISTEALDRWQQPGDVATNPKRTKSSQATSQPSTRFLQKSDHIRLQNVRFSWNMPRRMTSDIRMESLRLYVQGNNLALWSKTSGVDPDLVNAGGLAGFAYPISRTYSIGLNAAF